MSATDDLLGRNTRFAEGRTGPVEAAPPRLRVAIVACMDARMDLHAILGLEEGDAHVIRNAGGAVTADTIRSLAISQRLLGTREVVLIHHTGCGMLGLDDRSFLEEVENETGMRPDWATESFSDLDRDVRQSIARVRASPFLPHRDAVRGFVYELETGRVREVACD